jgi:hypothetical protein
MPTTQQTTNKASFSRFCDAMNTCDPQFISETIDDLVEPEARIFTSRSRM